jgi:NAD(P)H dehydrogenase (quinone)
MFTVIGITGKVGGAVARVLLDAGLPVRAVVRVAAKGAPWMARGCELAVADLDKAAALAAAFTGVHGAFAMLPPIFDPTPGFPEAKAMIATLRATLAEALPPKLVVLSTVGADATQPNLLNQLGLLERALADLPIRITFLRPGWFMENAAADIASASENGVIRSYLQPLDHAVPMIGPVPRMPRRGGFSCSRRTVPWRSGFDRQADRVARACADAVSSGRFKDGSAIVDLEYNRSEHKIVLK